MERIWVHNHGYEESFLYQWDPAKSLWGAPKFINGISHSESLSHVSTAYHMLFPFTCIKSSQLTYLNLKIMSKTILNWTIVKKLSDTFINRTYVLVSSEVISFFTNILIDLTIDSVANNWEFIWEKLQNPQKKFLKAVSIVLNLTYFLFNNCFYKQTFGTPIGSPLFPIIADLVIRDLEEKALERIGTQVLFSDMWYCYGNIFLFLRWYFRYL